MKDNTKDIEKVLEKVNHYTDNEQLKDIDKLIEAIKTRMIKNKWTDHFTDTTIINTALAFTLDNMDKFNNQYK
jgi:hypothetical protein